MAPAIRAFEIENLRHHPGQEQLLQATVGFNFDDEMPDGPVTQHVAVTVRFSASETSTLLEVHEAVFQKAVEQLRRALDLAEGQSAKQLRDAVAANLDAARKAGSPEAWDGS